MERPDLFIGGESPCPALRRPCLSLPRRPTRGHQAGGLAIPAHPLVPYPLCAQGWVLRRLRDDPDPAAHPDALETFNPTSLGKPWHNRVVRFADAHGLSHVGNSDAHAPGDTVGRPHNVVRAQALSTAALLDSLRVGRSYAVESSAVTVELTASANGVTAGPGAVVPLATVGSSTACSSSSVNA